MAIFTETISLNTQGHCDIHDITGQAQEIVHKHGLQEGQILLFVPGSTGGLTTVEYEPGLMKDLPEAFERLAPSNQRYHHDDTWGDGNGHSHVRASLVGPSLTVPFPEANSSWAPGSKSSSSISIISLVSETSLYSYWGNNSKNP